MPSTCELAFISCQGVRFYSLAGKRIPYGTKVKLQSEPANPYDANAVCVMVEGADGRFTPLGHLEAKAALWLSPVLLGPVITRV